LTLDHRQGVPPCGGTTRDEKERGRRVLASHNRLHGRGRGSAASRGDGRQGAMASSTDNDQIVVGLLDGDRSLRVAPTAVRTFRTPNGLFLVAMPDGGAVVFVLAEDGGKHWFVSFVDASGKVLGPPSATDLSVRQLIRVAFASSDGRVLVVQYPEYLPGNLPDEVLPVTYTVLDRAHPQACTSTVAGGGYVNSNDELTLRDPDGKGDGVVLPYVRDPSAPLPPRGKGDALFLRGRSPPHAVTRSAAPAEPRLEFVPFLGTTQLLRMENNASTPLPPIELAAIVGAHANLVETLAQDTVWTGSHMLWPPTRSTRRHVSSPSRARRIRECFGLSQPRWRWRVLGSGARGGAGAVRSSSRRDFTRDLRHAICGTFARTV
jgi:hypothetical protein